jgi:hypothetical protein
MFIRLDEDLSQEEDHSRKIVLGRSNDGCDLSQEDDVYTPRRKRSFLPRTLCDDEDLSR